MFKNHRINSRHWDERQNWAITIGAPNGSRFRRSIEIETIASPYWAPTLEFKLHLSEPQNCTLGLGISEDIMGCSLVNIQITM